MHLKFRFKVSAVFDDHDSSQSKFSPRFKMETKLQSPPKVIPLVSKILNISDTSLSINWVLPENATTKEDVIGYFILFRESSTAGDYSHLTIFGEGTHSHILDNLKPGTSYDIKVQAFNMNGGGHYSKVQYGRTNGPNKKGKGRKSKLKSSKASTRDKGFSKEGPKDDDATTYLTIGVSLGLVCVISLGACSVFTCVQRRRRSSKFSDSNAAIHSKYQVAKFVQCSSYFCCMAFCKSILCSRLQPVQDTSLQITGQQQENRGMDEALDWRVGDANKVWTKKK